MYERFTDRARKVMKLANEQAVRLHHRQVDIEHVLLGLSAEGSGVAANVLKHLGADFQRCRAEVEKLTPPLPAEILPDGALPLTSPATQLVEASLQEAKHLEHHYVGTEHLILAVTRQQGAAVQALANLGIKPEDLRCEVLNLLGHFVDAWPLSDGAM